MATWKQWDGKGQVNLERSNAAKVIKPAPPQSVKVPQLTHQRPAARHPDASEPSRPGHLLPVRALSAAPLRVRAAE